ncbi:MAG TPA: ATP-binding protein [Malonomonas sp.]
MDTHIRGGFWRRRAGRGYYLWTLASFWTLLLLCSLYWNYQNATRQVLQLVQVQARTAYEKDVLYRFWNSSHGLVYVPVSSETPPNPYLQVPERDISTPSGTPLTLMNPAYMTRQANELGQARLGIYGHLTSLMPLRPGNAPDEWEREALLAFEQGVPEISHVSELDGKTVMRLMRPLLVEQECIECHAHQGYKVGEIRGGISVSIDMAASLALLQSAKIRLVVGHLLLWLTGLAGLIARSRQLVKRDSERLQAKEQLQQVNRELETRVAERTQQLQESNQLLEEDIRQRILGEQQRQLLAEQLRQSQKMEVVGTLAGGIAHDFNNLLTPILGYAELAMQRPEANEALQKDLKRIFSAAEQAKGLVKQILSFSRRSDQQRTAVSMQQIVREVFELIRPTFPKSLDIKLQLPEKDLVVDADPVQMHQVVMNLCTNAWQAMGGKGELQISLEPTLLSAEESKKLNISAGDSLCLKVFDSGCGIDTETLEKIFDPFFTTKKSGEGTGLGLAVVQGILLGHGGAIRVESVIGQGSCFSVYLPLSESVQRLDAEQPLPRAQGELILLVDDNEGIVTLLREGLSAFGYRVDAYCSSQQALDAFRRQPAKYDLLLSDRMMPELSGQQLAEQVRLLRPEFPVLFMTGYDAAEDFSSPSLPGADPCLAKPVTASEVARRIVACLAT